MTPNVMNFLTVKNRARTNRLELAKQKSSKKTRNKRKYDKLVEYTTIARKERAKRDGEYRTGMNLETVDVNPEAATSVDASAKATPKRPRTVSVCVHPFCRKKGHKTTKSKHCLANPDRLRKEGLEAACLAAVAAVTESENIDGSQDTTLVDNNDTDAANDLAEYESQPFEEFEEDLFYTSGTWSEDEDGNVVLKSGVI